MGSSAPCPFCGAPREAAADPVAAALEELNRQVALIRAMAEKSSRQDREIRLLRETIARLRGTAGQPRESVRAVVHSS